MLSKMIMKLTVLKIMDNIGAKKAKCIHILEKKRWAKLSGLILIVLRRIHSLRKKLKKKAIYLGVVICTNYWIARKTGFFLKIEENRVLVFNNQFKFLGTRVYGLLSWEFKKKVYRYFGFRFYYKLLSYSSSAI